MISDTLAVGYFSLGVAAILLYVDQTALFTEYQISKKIALAGANSVEATIAS